MEQTPAWIAFHDILMYCTYGKTSCVPFIIHQSISNRIIQSKQ